MVTSADKLDDGLEMIRLIESLMIDYVSFETSGNLSIAIYWLCQVGNISWLIEWLIDYAKLVTSAD